MLFLWSRQNIKLRVYIAGPEDFCSCRLIWTLLYLTAADRFSVP
jgi:hypothetical protein